MAFQALIAVGLIAPVAGFFAFILWMAKMPGDPVAARSPRATAAIAAGIITGILMGPMVLGRIAPPFHNDAFIGTAEQLQAFDRLMSEHRAERAALLETGVSEIALEELRADQTTAAESQREAIHAAEQTHRRALLAWALLPLAVVAGIGFGLGLGNIRRTTSQTGTARPTITAALRQSLLLALGFGLVLLIARLFVDQWWPAAAFAGGMSVVGVPAIAGRSRRGWTASIAGNTIAAATTAAAGIIATAAGCLTGHAAARLSGPHTARTLRRLGALAAFGIALPTAIALPLATIDPADLLSDRSFAWLALLAFLIGGDFRWAAIALGRIDEPKNWRTAAEQIDQGTGALQAIAAATLILTGPLIGLAQSASIGAALLIGALTIELGKPIRHGMARSLDGRDDETP